MKMPPDLCVHIVKVQIIICWKVICENLSAQITSTNLCLLEGYFWKDFFLPKTAIFTIFDQTMEAWVVWPLHSGAADQFKGEFNRESDFQISHLVFLPGWVPSCFSIDIWEETF